MKSPLSFLICLTALLLLSACSDKPNRPSPVLTQSQIDAANARAAAEATNPAISAPTAQTPEPPQNAAGVWHYTCTNGCAGGGGSATACASCGNLLVHNTAYHDTPAAAPVGAASNGATTIPPPITPAGQQQPEPAQNAAGVWHYTCTNGCAGGAGSAVACASCGNLLVHNQGYH